MKRQHFYPRQQASQPEWHFNFRTKLLIYATPLGLAVVQVNPIIADNQMMEYGLGAWITNVRDFTPSCTAALDLLASGTGGDPFVFPVFNLPTAPTLPAGITVVMPGALDRIFRFVQVIKGLPGYTDAMGIDLGIVGEEDTAEYTRPEFTLKSEAGDGCECVKIRFKKFGHSAVAIYSRRGSGGWELIGTPELSPFEDERQLLVAGQPEIREYRMRFRDNGIENGDWTDVASVTVSM